MKKYISSLLNFGSFRRDYLDDFLSQNQHLFKGDVLDIGGKKINKRGKFKPPLSHVNSWKYLNNDSETEPDYCCDAENIPLADQSINVVIMTELLEYLPFPKKVLKEASRVLHTKGYLIISSPLLNPIHGDYWADRTRHSPVSLKEMIESTGLEIESIEPMGSLGAVVYDIFRVAGGYGHKRSKRSITSLLLPLLRPFFYLLDKIYESQKEFITTGYFLIAVKKRSENNKY